MSTTFEQRLRDALAPEPAPSTPTIVIQPAPPAPGPYRWLATPNRDPETKLILSIDLMPVERVTVPDLGATP